MTKPAKNLLAFDLGAESGRVILGKFNGDCLELSEIHRFSNGPTRLPMPGAKQQLRWNVLNLWNEIQRGIAMASKSGEIAGMGLDAWGCDFCLLDRQEQLIGNPFHYRDDRTDGMLEEAFQRIPRQAIFAQTGIQFMQLNTLYQLLSMVVHHSPELEIAQTFLTIPDLFNFWLTGVKACEFTNATTTQCYNPLTEDWAWPVIQALGIPERIFPEVIPPGIVLGRLSQTVAANNGVPPIPVITPACHDTGSAVAAVPAQGERFAWISSGTWSIVGVEVKQPVINESSLNFNLTNEGGIDHTYRFSKNVMGLWLMQECRNTWERQGEKLMYDDLTRLAEAEMPLRAIVDPDAIEFLKPGDMPARIRAFCQRTGQPVPESKGAIVRCALESVALKYRWVLEKLESILGYRLEPIHIVGGGTKNRLLSQFTANATGRQVFTGPVEATATGNLMVQALALGEVTGMDQVRQVVRRSVEPETFEPADPGLWQDAYGRLLEILDKYPS